MAAARRRACATAATRGSHNIYIFIFLKRAMMQDRQDAGGIIEVGPLFCLLYPHYPDFTTIETHKIKTLGHQSPANALPAHLQQQMGIAPSIAPFSTVEPKIWRIYTRRISQRPSVAQPPQHKTSPGHARRYKTAIRLLRRRRLNRQPRL